MRSRVMHSVPLEDANAETATAVRLIASGQLASAAPILRQLSSSANNWATVMLGWMYMVGRGVERDQAKAESLFLQAAARNDKLAMFYLGRSKADAQDFESAFAWFNRCGAMGFPPCECWLGLSLVRGIGVAPDHQRGVYFLRLAAKAGNYPAQRELAAMMFRGDLGLHYVPVGGVLFVYWFFVALVKSVAGRSFDHVVG